MSNANTTTSEFARSLLLDPKKLEAELLKLDTLSDSPESAEAHQNGMLRPGISVVVATHKAESRISVLLNSILNQEMAPGFFEFIFVINGQLDSTPEILKEFSEGNPELNIRWCFASTKGAGNARNLGMQLASFEYLTFVDDDDEIEPNFLSTAFDNCGPNTVVLSPIHNVDSDGQLIVDNVLNQRIMSLNGQETQPAAIPWAFGFNACKTIPTGLARKFEYRTDLDSGEDLVFFANFLTAESFQVKPLKYESNAYLRHLRDDSVSRRNESFEFNVLQRLDCVSALDAQLTEIMPKGTEPEATPVNALRQAQFGFVQRYLENNPSVAESVNNELAIRRIFDFPWNRVSNSQSSTLVFSYCFPPFVDSAGVVAAKVIAAEGKRVDVISNDMSINRYTDKSLNFLCNRWINRSEQLKTPTSFAGSDHVAQFATAALKKAEEWNYLNNGYERVYSRAMWIGSHVAAILFAERHPEVKWQAEFSDPLKYDASHNLRVGSITENFATKQMAKAIKSRGFDPDFCKTIFELVELSTILVADELVFTNTNQLEYMASDYSDPKLREIIAKKAIVRNHPSPVAEAYTVSETSLQLPHDVINIGYFGSFYPNRGLHEVFPALANLTLDERRKLRLHVFSNKKDEVKSAAEAAGIEALVYSRSFLPYMEFLNAATKFDVLLVNDVQRNEKMLINPFLPSKYSDYKGAGSKIWAIVDEGSPLSNTELDYKSRVGNIPSIIKSLKAITEEFEQK